MDYPFFSRAGSIPNYGRDCDLSYPLKGQSYCHLSLLGFDEADIYYCGAVCGYETNKSILDQRLLLPPAYVVRREGTVLTFKKSSLFPNDLEPNWDLPVS